VGLSIGPDEAIDVELGIMHRVSKIASVPPGLYCLAACILDLVQQPLIHPIPDEASLHVLFAYDFARRYEAILTHSTLLTVPETDYFVLCLSSKPEPITVLLGKLLLTFALRKTAATLSGTCKIARKRMITDLKVRVGFKGFPVLLVVSIGVAHGMGILALDQGPCLRGIIGPSLNLHDPIFSHEYLA